MSELRLTEAAERFGGTLLNPDGCFCLLYTSDAADE